MEGEWIIWAVVGLMVAVALFLTLAPVRKD
jgi:hypothetical protein